MRHSKERVLVAMSGGVDSSVAALLLKEQGYDVIGVTMKLWSYPSNGEGRARSCCSPSDIQDARRVADQLGIPFYVLNMEKKFKEEVIKNFIKVYRSGKTPNPCILCNTRMKFHHLLKKADELGASSLATGHYAVIIRNGNRYSLRKAMDVRKDQSYFLFGIPPEFMHRILFPLGGLLKREVRAIAKSHGLRVAEKPDSQEICFIPHNDYGRFLKTEAGLHPERGKIVDSDGEVLGYHDGYFHFTVGQREGLGISSGKRRYVLRIDAEKNTVVVGESHDTFGREFYAEGLNWLVPLNGTGEINCAAKIRYRHEDAGCRVLLMSHGRARVIFEAPQRAITPGQAVVFYRGSEVMGGGWIE